MTVPEVALYLGVRKAWVYEHAECGDLPCIRLGTMLRFNSSDLEAWLREQSRGRPIDALHDGSGLLSVDELAVELRVSKSWLYEARRSKGLPHYKLGALLRFSRALVSG